MATRPAIFKWRQSEPEFILCAVRWHPRYSLSLRDIEELLEERGLEADHTTVWRWVQCYGPEMERRMRRHLKPTNKSWRADETYIRVKGALVLPVSGNRFQRCHHRFPVVGAA
jgi:transposase-like protein